ADVARSDVVQVEKELTATVLLNDHSRMLALLHQMEVRVRKAIGQHVHVTTVPLERIPDQNVLYFNYQYTRFIYSSEQHSFEPFEIDIGPRYSDIAFRASGLTQAEALERQRLVGTNFISVPVPSFLSAVAREFVGVFYLYQLIIIWLYYYYAYYQIGIVDTCVILISALVRVVVRLQSEKRLKSMAEHMDSCQVLRDNEWRLLATTELVPGDVFEVTDGQVVPCDAVVLAGNVIVNESSLTGEPLPVRKFAIRDDNTYFTTSDSGKNNLLFSGTTVSQADPLDKSRNPIAMVHRTGTATIKGQLIRNILFPNPINFIFDEQLKVVLLILAAQGVVMFGLSLWLLHSNFNASWFYGMISLAQLINPILPAALVVGQSIASMRLRKRKIFCVDLPRIMVAGKIQMFCFDKTGTLTKEGLEFDGVQPVLHQGRYLAREPEVESQFEMVYKPGDSEFGQQHRDFSNLSQLLKMGLASCHSVAEVNHQLIGNPVDIEMFRSSGWELRYPDNDQYLDTICHPNDPSNERIHVVKRYEFDHARASMSVAVLDPKTNHVHIFVKGSFEKVRDLAQSATIPRDYNEVTAQLARQGCYVLAMAHRDLGSVDPASLSHWSRDRMEEEISLVGLVLFKNNLKPDTADAIAELKQGSTRTVMITGDTALTGVFIARACGLAPANDRMLLGDINAKRGDVVWTDVDTNEPVDLHQALLQAHQDPQHDVELAVTGKAFNILMARDQIREYLLSIRVFARMTPQDKVDCIQLHMERGITAMCGDGGNDCGALRAAHVGLALSEAEASIVSPFSTSVRSIYSCVELMRQGRAALATSFAGYKYLILYGQTMAMMKTFTFYFSTSISQALWIVVDAFITVGMTVALSYSKPASQLAPQRPTARILGPQTLCSTIGLVVINWLFLIGGHIWLFRLDWLRCHEFNSRAADLSKWWLLGDNYESSLLAFVTCFQFVNSAAVYNFGYVFRQSWWKNYWLMSLWAVFVAMMSYVLLADPNWLGCLFRLNCGNPRILEELGYSRPSFYIEPYNIEQGHNVFPSTYRILLWVYCMSNILAGILWERVVVLGPIRTLVMNRWPLDRLKVKL
ncbi:hypothetical protein H4R35_006400, partial [Dimargaris xerosporica]